MAGRLSSFIILILAMLLFGSSVAASPPAQTIQPAAAVQLLADAAYFPALLGKINTAQDSVVIMMYLWKTPSAIDNKPGELAEALGKARRRGVEVKVILENSGHDEGLNQANRETANFLDKEGITVLFDSPTVTSHTKMAVIDRRFCFVGSHNLTQSALARNHELSLLLDDRELAGQLINYSERISGPSSTPRPTRKEPRQSARQ